MNYTNEQIQELDVASKSVYYFASLCLPDIYKQQLHLLDTYMDEQNCLSLVSRQCGNTTIEACYALWVMIFKHEKRIGYNSTCLTSATHFIQIIVKLNEKLPEYMRASFSNTQGNKIQNELTKSVILTNAYNSTCYRGLTLHLLILDCFHFISENNFKKFYSHLYPCLVACNTQVIMSSSINVKGFKLYDIFKCSVLEDFNINVIPYYMCSGYSQKAIENIKNYLSIDALYKSAYLCIDGEGNNYVK